MYGIHPSNHWNDICRCIPLFTSKMSDKTSDWQPDDAIGASDISTSARMDGRRHPFFSFPHHLPLLSVQSRTPHSRFPWGDTRRMHIQHFRTREVCDMLILMRI